MKHSQAVDDLVEVVRDPHARLRSAVREGRGTVGYFCSYVPVELIHAAGFTPVRLLQGPPPGDVAGRYMQPFCCSFARSLLEGLGDGTCGYLSAVVMPHTCDTIRNLSDLVESAAPGLRVLRLMVPTVTHTAEAVDFMLAETRALQEDLEGLAGEEVDRERLFQSIRLYNRCRNALAVLRGSGLGNRALYAAHLAFQLMDPEGFLALASSLPREPVDLGAAAGEAGGAGRGGAGVALVGGPVPQLEVFDLLQEYGLEVVWDDLCTASRFAAGAVDEECEPLRALAERYLRRRPCPTKRDPANRREEELLAGISAGGARGVVFIQQAFCEFHSFDYPGLKQRLDAEGIPSVRLDLESPFQPTGQMRTRLQALSEMMGGGR